MGALERSFEYAKPQSRHLFLKAIVTLLMVANVGLFVIIYKFHFWAPITSGQAFFMTLILGFVLSISGPALWGKNYRLLYPFLMFVSFLCIGSTVGFLMKFGVPLLCRRGIYVMQFNSINSTMTDVDECSRIEIVLESWNSYFYCYCAFQKLIEIYITWKLMARMYGDEKAAKKAYLESEARAREIDSDYSEDEDMIVYEKIPQDAKVAAALKAARRIQKIHRNLAVNAQKTAAAIKAQNKAAAAASAASPPARVIDRSIEQAPEQNSTQR